VIAVRHLRELAQVRPHLAHPRGELAHLAEDSGLVQVLEDPLAVPDGTGVPQAAGQDGADEVAFLAIPGDRGHDLVQVQVPRGRIVRAVASGRLLTGQQAGQDIQCHGTPPVRPQEPSAIVSAGWDRRLGSGTGAS
jgi:hypothetical protein